MHHDVKTTAKWLGKVVDGWLNYYAVPTSFRYLYRFVLRLKHLWLRMLRHRSQRDRSGWARVAKLTATHWPKLDIRHPWPDQRFVVSAPKGDTQGRSPMPLTGTSGSVRGAPGNRRPYRNPAGAWWVPRRS